MTTYFSRPVVTSYCLLCYLLLLAPSVFSAQAAPPIVQKVEVKFQVPPPGISKENILAILSVKKGLPYNGRRVQQDIRSLYATRLISDVCVFAEPLSNGVKIIFLVQGLPSIESVSIKGTNQIPIARVRKEISTKAGQPLWETRLADDRQKIIALYKNKHYGQIQVAFSICPTSKKNRVRVLFKVTEGPCMVIRKISFVGNHFLSGRKLRSALKTKSRNLLSFINKSGRLTPEQLTEDKQRIRLLYQNHGFADARCIGTQIRLSLPQRAEIIYAIEEGVRYRIRSVRFDGGVSSPPDKLRVLTERSKLKPGSLYTNKGLHAAIRAINSFYGEQGYLDCVVTVHSVPADTSKVDLLFSINEGRQFYTNLIKIQGNTRTKDFVIRRELALKPGELFNTKRISASRVRLQNLNYFSRVDLVPQSTALPRRKDLSILLKEKPTGSFNIGAGYSSIDSAVGFVELQQTNFNLFGWPTFYGAGQRLRMRMQCGLERKDFLLSLTEPWFLNYKLSVGTEGYYHDADYLSTVYDQLYYGGAIHFRLPVASFLSVRGEYQDEWISIHGVAKNAGSYIQASQGQYMRSSFSMGLDYDTRDNLFLPRHGTTIRYTNFLSGGPLGGSVHTYGLSLDAAQYILLPRDFVFMLKAKIAFICGWGEGDGDVPIFDRLYLGGGSDLRGFNFRDVGPKDNFGNPIGGTSLFCGTLEVTFPILPKRIRGAFFTDWGSVNASNYDFSTKNMNGDIGIGIRIDLPIGAPVRFDFGYPIRYDKYNRNKGRFQFNVGHQF